MRSIARVDLHRCRAQEQESSRTLAAASPLVDQATRIRQNLGYTGDLVEDDEPLRNSYVVARKAEITELAAL